MHDHILPLTSHLLEGQRRRPRQGAAPVDLAAHEALILLVLDYGGVVHHGEVGVLAVPQTGEDVLVQRRRDRGRERGFTGAAISQSVHPQIFASVLIALVNSCRLFICCRLMQPKSHYVWMDAVPFCRAARQI